MTYKQLLESAERAAERAEYERAAGFYEQAYALKPSRLEPAYRAADLYYQLRDYQRAADGYDRLPPEQAERPLMGLRHARALKQSGNYPDAETRFNTFQKGYVAADRAVITELIAGEIAGIALARRMEDTDLAVTPLAGEVNSNANETSPSAANSGQLFFIGSSADRSRILTSQQNDGNWKRPAPPSGFPVISGGQVRHGRFSDDGRTYFFSVCATAAADRCEIYRTSQKLSGAWKQPARLGETVNAPGSNNSYPSALALDDGRQVLYFASDRTGSRGGMDIYRATQLRMGDPTEYGELVRLGDAINSPGHEVSPVFDRQSQILYFASDGLPGYGGFDLFRSQRNKGTYDRSVNMGRPANSPADDVGLTLPGVSGQALFSSNRRFATVKTRTVDDDLYALQLGASGPSLRASVYDAGRRALADSELLVYETSGGGEREILRQQLPGPSYAVPLRAGAGYRIVVRKPGYAAAEYRVQTEATGAAVYGRSLYLQPTGEGPDAGGATNPAVTDPDHAPAAAPPTAYRIQISATREFDPAEQRFTAVKELAELRTESIPGRDLKRITVGYFAGLEEARALLPAVREAGFEDAFIVRYDDGKRFGRVR